MGRIKEKVYWKVEEQDENMDKGGRRASKENIVAWTFNLPTLVILLGIVFVPIIQAAYMSTLFYNLKLPQMTRFIGLDNYISLILDPLFWFSLRVTATFTIISVLIVTGVGLIFALLLSQEFKGRGILRALLLIPWAVTGVMAGILWRWMYNPEYGFINILLNSIGIKIGSYAWLNESSTALLSVAIAYAWSSTPIATILYLGALQSLPIDLYDSAKVDGAGSWQRFYLITFPLLKPTTMIILIITTMFALKEIGLVYVMTGGGPGNETTVLGWLIYSEAFKFLDFGRGAAVSFILAAITIVIATFYIKSLYKEVEF
ncbi:MAG: sugar ABC transporter permease [Candidatus Micrarchaeia archaeon]